MKPFRLERFFVLATSAIVFFGRTPTIQDCRSCIRHKPHNRFALKGNSSHNKRFGGKPLPKAAACEIGFYSLPDTPKGAFADHVGRKTTTFRVG